MVIAIVGVTALVATTLGVVFYEELAGEETLTFELVTDEDLFIDSAEGVGSGPREFAFALPDNATSADFDITVTFRGTAGQGANVQVSAYFVDPTGNRSNEAQDTLSLSANEGPGDSVTLNLQGTWATMPAGGNTTDIDEAAKAARKSWDNQPIIVYVTIGSASGDALLGVIPAVNSTYDIDVAGDLTRFQRQVDPVPDPTGGQ